MSSVNEILYVTKRNQLAGDIRTLKFIGEQACKKAEHKDVREAGKEITTKLAEVEETLAALDPEFQTIINQAKGK